MTLKWPLVHVGGNERLIYLDFAWDGYPIERLVAHFGLCFEQFGRA